MCRTHYIRKTSETVSVCNVNLGEDKQGRGKLKSWIKTLIRAKGDMVIMDKGGKE